MLSILIWDLIQLTSFDYCLHLPVSVLFKEEWHTQVLFIGSLKHP
jgi:hypothetical protein